MPRPVRAGWPLPRSRAHLPQTFEEDAFLAGVVAAGTVRDVDVAAIALIGFVVVCSASRRSSASRQASSARRPIAFIARTSILAPRSDCEERRLATRWRTHAPCRVPPAGRTRRPCAAAPWVSSRSSSARICFSSASETRLRLTYSPQPGHVPRSPAHEKRQPQKQATSISDYLPRPAAVPADASFGL